MTKLKVKSTSSLVKISGLLVLGVVLLIGAGLAMNKPVQAEPEVADIVVYKSPTCGCCKKWVSHVQDNGFAVEAHNVKNLNVIKSEAGVPRNLQSCHTAKVGGYIIEGHVPADLIAKLLKEKPAIKGLSVPGMVTGSPGMEMPGRPADAYNVVTIEHDGSSKIYASR